MAASRGAQEIVVVVRGERKPMVAAKEGGKPMVTSRRGGEPGGSGGNERERDSGGDERRVYRDSGERRRRIQDGSKMARGTYSDGEGSKTGHRGSGNKARGGGESVATRCSNSMAPTSFEEFLLVVPQIARTKGPDPNLVDKFALIVATGGLILGYDHP